MRSRCLLRVLAGAFALGATLALSPGGVHAEPGDADSGPMSTVPEAPMCRMSDPERVPATLPDGALARLRQEVQRELEAGGDGIIELNTQGYGYHNQAHPSAQREILDREAAAQRAASEAGPAKRAR